MKGDLFDRSGGREGGRKTPQVAPNEAVFLDPWLTAKGDPLAALVDDIMPIVSPSGPRARRLRRDAEENLRLCTGNVVANLVSYALSPIRGPDKVLAIPTARTKATRYDREGYPKHLLLGLLKSLEREGFISIRPYIYRERSTTVEPTDAFTRLMERQGVQLSDIGRDHGAETIWLSARTGETPFGNRPLPKCLIHYHDTEETQRLRAEVERLNAFLNEATIAFDGKPVAPIALRRMFLLRHPIDPVRFDLNGRLAGGFWMSLPASQRHLITIGGEDIADLDFVSIFPILLYLKATGKLPSGDPYDIPGLEGHRKGAKLAILSLLSRSADMQRLSPELKAALPEGWTAKRLVEAVTRRHPAIADCFGADIGIKLMNTESRILMAVLLELARVGIPAQGLHDGLHVPRLAIGTAASVMEATTRQMLGVALPVAEKTVLRPTARLAA